ncbi:predicted protein [Sclerotinia sclerotiorum 1980 UF-70]|uniref:Uncharacterized protein n=1 Tax=Sclerotinia sclerotiorum (strain ATCC 18683 / 1980 / Ss-1) TaxID=665079 RepID=A7EUS2_SCLS1|nr:predicted protein [Sclerotinia sclerotiorum 1980 UF-70]EDN93214.1 predicted protein [Sclerotinia sclerotiorum 1980 UF-70]
MGCCSGGVVWCMVVYGVWCMADYLDGFGAKEFRRGRMNECECGNLRVVSCKVLCVGCNVFVR